MGVWDFVGAVFEKCKPVGRAIMDVVAPMVATVVDAAKDLVRAVEKAVREEFRPPPKTEKEKLERELEDINNRIQALRKRHQDRGSLTDRENRDWQHLKAQRKDINQDLRNLDQLATAEEMTTKPRNFDVARITDETSHILQYHVGQSTYNKTCRCGRPMVLQWQRVLAAPTIRDFYWGCSGFYFPNLTGQPACRATERLSEGDLNIFADLRRPEFQVGAVDFSKIATGKNANRIRQALDSIRDTQQKRKTGIELYRCPFHGELMVLRRKVSTDQGLLDEYFLGCKRWVEGNTGCNFIVKLKSAAQISSVMNSEKMGGVIAAVN